MILPWLCFELLIRSNPSDLLGVWFFFQHVFFLVLWIFLGLSKMLRMMLLLLSLVFLVLLRFLVVQGININLLLMFLVLLWRICLFVLLKVDWDMVSVLFRLVLVVFYLSVSRLIILVLFFILIVILVSWFHLINWLRLIHTLYILKHHLSIGQWED